MANEVGALLEVAGEALDRVAITPAQSLHLAVAGRVFRATAPASAPIRLAHDAIANLSYSAVRAATIAGTRATAAAVRAAGGAADLRPLSRSSRGRLALGALNGIAGDLLDARGSELAIEMALRVKGRDVGLSRAALARAYPGARPRMVVLLHGLAETEEWWDRRGRGHFGRRLERDLGVSSVEVRYNSGLPVVENGARLAALLETLAAEWPVAVEDIALVGHSMGGLVARSATRSGGAFAARVRHLVTLGTPHTGAPLEKAAHAAARVMRWVPETMPFARVLDLRSAGIRDLREGDPSAWRLAGCTHTLITVTITSDPRHPLGWIAGDLLVRTDSASGRHRTRRVAVPEDQVVHAGGLNHFDLLDAPAVYQHLRSVLARTPARSTSARAGTRNLDVGQRRDH